MTRLPLSALGLLLCAALPACTSSPAEPERATAHASALSGGLEAYYVVLDGPPAASRIPAGVDARSPSIAAATRDRVVEIDAEHAALLPALERHRATVVARMSRLANAIQILAYRDDIADIGRLPGVRRVERVPLATRTLASAVPLVGGNAAWTGAPPVQGDGVTVGIIDSGIDYTHADFGGPGTPDAYLANDPTKIEPGSFPTAKVVGGWDLVGDAYDASNGASVPKPDPDPLDCTAPESAETSGGHGTHVSGIVAGAGVTADGATYDGPYEASFGPAMFRVAPGVAPRARLYALKVFGCAGSTAMLGAALERAADPDQDGVFDDRLDVVNASLGTAYALSSPTTGEIVANLTKAGTLIVAAAGNDGQTFFATGAPASYPEVLSVAASADNDFLTLAVTSPAAAIAEYPTAEGAFVAPLFETGTVSGELVATSPADGCAPLSNADAIAGNIALLDRGTCPFVEKLANAVAAGAIAGVVVDNADSPLPFAMDGDPGSSPVPAVLVRQADGAVLKAALAGGPLTIALDPAHRYTGPGAELVAGFSSRGPSPADGRLKPEIAAPGVSIDSALVGSGTEPLRSQGTSMASPMVAGAAALVRQAQPALTALEVKAALVNTAATLRNLTGNIYGTGVVGGGRLAVDHAVQQLVTAAADPATGEIGVSFGAVVAAKATTVKRTFVVTNHGASAVSLAATLEPTFALPGVDVTVAPASVDVPAGQTATLELTLSLDPVALGSPGPDPGTPAMQGGQNPLPRHYLNEATGLVRLVGGAEDVTLPYNGSVRAAAERTAVPPSACATLAGPLVGPVEIALAGDSAHPAPVVTAFQLGAVDAEDEASATDPVVALTDLRAVGVATDLATAATFEEAQVFFGIAVSGTWTTPARGPLSVVSIEIDSEGGPNPDYAIRAEARNADGPFRDALVASIYDLSSGTRVNRRPLDIVTPDIAETNPFNNSVLVLSALLSEIGVKADSPVFNYTATTESPDLLVGGERLKASFDLSQLTLDTAVHGNGGAPIFVGSPVTVEIAADAYEKQSPLDLLLFHHTNVAGKRFEIVSLLPRTPGNLMLAASAPPTVSASGTETVTFTVTNGTEPAPNARLAGKVDGGEMVSAEGASCAPGQAIDCTIGDIPAGGSVSVVATVRPTAGSKAVAIEASVKSDLECESNDADNDAAVAISVLADPLPPDEEALVAAGGCGCRVDPRTTGAAHAAWLAFGLVVARRRRRLRGASGAA